ncbi:class I SAM-dependent methyltransferase [Noviherbaspirillum sp.]|uniref:class I SAM-dependent methyltransferase n=1 Tax=Noviherbaspirillum sp. TaxID=1926288 RepID=UPI002FE151BE
MIRFKFHIGPHEYVGHTPGKGIAKAKAEGRQLSATQKILDILPVKRRTTIEGLLRRVRKTCPPGQKAPIQSGLNRGQGSDAHHRDIPVPSLRQPLEESRRNAEADRPAAEAASSFPWEWDASKTRPLSREAPPLPYLSRFLRNQAQGALKTGAMLEVGFEDGSGVRAFMEAGWRKIHAVDMDARCLPMIQEEVDAGHAQVQIARIQDAALPFDMDVVHAHYVLAFLGDDLPRTLQRLCDATRPGGYLICAFMGPDHSWKNRPGVHVYDQSQLTHLLHSAGYENIVIDKTRRENIRDQGGKPVAVWDALIVRASKPRSPQPGPPS